MNTLDNNNENDDNNVGKADSLRKSYPAKTVKSLIEFTSPIYTELGHSDYHSKEVISQTHNLAYATIKQTLASAKLHNLLELKHGTGYKVTPLFVKIFQPVDENEKMQGVLECIRKFDVFNSLLDEYNGHVVPSEDGLANSIHRKYGYNKRIAKRIAELFYQNLNDYGLIGAKGVLNIKTINNINTNPNKVDSKITDIEEPISHPDNKGNDNNNELEITIPLKPGIKARLYLPEDYTEEYLDRISKFVEALK